MNQCFTLFGPGLALASLLIAAGCETGPATRPQWTSLFNGQDLTGWMIQCQPADQGKVFWTVDRLSLIHI